MTQPCTARMTPRPVLHAEAPPPLHPRPPAASLQPRLSPRAKLAAPPRLTPRLPHATPKHAEVSPRRPTAPLTPRPTAAPPPSAAPPPEASDPEALPSAPAAEEGKEEGKEGKEAGKEEEGEGVEQAKEGTGRDGEEEAAVPPPHAELAFLCHPEDDEALHYFRAESAADARGALRRLPNPYRLLPLVRSVAFRLVELPDDFATVSSGGVTLFRHQMAHETYSLSEWHDLFHCFEKVLCGYCVCAVWEKERRVGAVRLSVCASAVCAAPVFLRWSRRLHFIRWLAWGAPAVTARTVEPALRAALHAAGWIASCTVSPGQIDAKDGAVVLGLRNAEAVEEQLRRSSGALVSAVQTLQEVLSSKEMQPLASPCEGARKYVLSTYSRRLFPLVAPSLLNEPARMTAVSSSSVASTLLPPMPLLRGAPLRKLEKLCGETKAHKLAYATRAIAGEHLRPFTRRATTPSQCVVSVWCCLERTALLLRKADMMIMGALLQLPLDALRDLQGKMKHVQWRRLTSTAQVPVLHVRVERRYDDETQPLKINCPPAAELTATLLRNCVDALKGFTLPSQASMAAFSGIMDTHLYETVDEPRLLEVMREQMAIASQHMARRTSGDEGEEPDAAESTQGAVDAEMEAANLGWGTTLRGGAAARQAAKRANKDSRAAEKLAAEESSASFLGRRDEQRAKARTADGYRCVISELREMQVEIDSNAELAWKNHRGLHVELRPDASDAAGAPAGAGESGGRVCVGRNSPRREGLPTTSTLEEMLVRHCITEPIGPIRTAMAELEHAMTGALRRAEAAALAHEPFLKAARSLNSKLPPPTVRTLDVGCIRVDGSSLWPSEESEVEVHPLFAPLTLSNQLECFPPLGLVNPARRTSANFRRASVISKRASEYESQRVSLTEHPLEEAEEVLDSMKALLRQREAVRRLSTSSMSMKSAGAV
ncbi:hypothetical protein AB1Y20_021807 [Prymnesium parvum]|uniref:Uncharacterized protein n=1 Tax=Prymnesium parvum TaxID=97485 RepID=A0AB34JKG9_PRYPA